ncbi:MAG: 30S ribosome-binding factor RbfA [Bacteroidales bacterium]
MHKEESTRQLKVGRLIQRELALYFQREQSTICLGSMVTVTVVRVTPDLSIARVYLSIFPSQRAKETLDSINLHNKAIRYYLGTQVRNQLRIVPELEFFIDDSLDYFEKIDKLLKNP